MLGVVPVRRKTTKSVLGFTAWNLLVLSPFVLAYWILTETNHGSNRSCFGIPWDVANFARWSYLGFAIYQLATLPLNLFVIKRSHKIGHESRLTHWLQMGDTLHWLANWCLWFYIITALANRSQCHDKRMNDLLWANVFFSAAFALAGLLFGLVALAKFLKRMFREIAEEAKLRSAEGIDVIVAKGGLQQGLKQGGVEILEVRKANHIDDMNRVRPDQQVIRTEYVERRVIDGRNNDIVDKAEARVMDNGLAAETLKKEEEIVHRREVIRENVSENVRDRTSDPRYMTREERLDVDENLPVTNTNNIRTHDFHASQPRKF